VTQSQQTEKREKEGEEINRECKLITQFKSSPALTIVDI
jgi:hypothetical protein